MTSADRNVETVRTALDAWNRGEWDRALELAAPDLVVDNSSVQGEWRGVHHGPDASRALWSQFTEAWESVQVEMGDVFVAAPNVITYVDARFLGRDGIEVPMRNWWCWTLRDGLLVRLVVANELKEMLAAAGLDELPPPTKG